MLAFIVRTELEQRDGAGSGGDKEGIGAVTVYYTERLWSKTMWFFPPSSPQQVCASVTEPQLHLQWAWDTEHVSPICQTVCQHS